MRLAEGTDTKTTTHAWVMYALEDTRRRNQTKLVGYLEEVSDDVVFEAESAARRNEHEGAYRGLL